MKNRGVNREKKVYLLCKLNIKDKFILNSYIYNDSKSIDMFIKKASNNNKKKCLSLFTENTFIYLSRLKTEKFSGTPNQLVRKNSICCLKNDGFFFSQSKCTDSLDPLFPIGFCLLFKDPLPSLHHKNTF